MSAQMMIKAFEAVETDERLNPCDKLVLLRWAWKCRDAAPAVIRFKTYARELGLSVNGVKKAVRRLIEFGYLAETAVVVSAGSKMSPEGGSHSDTPQKQGDHTVTPRGSHSDPSRDHTVTPLQRKNIKKDFEASPAEVQEAVKHYFGPISTSEDRKEIREWLAKRGFAEFLENDAVSDLVRFA